MPCNLGELHVSAFDGSVKIATSQSNVCFPMSTKAHKYHIPNTLFNKGKISQSYNLSKIDSCFCSLPYQFYDKSDEYKYMVMYLMMQKVIGSVVT